MTLWIRSAFFARYVFLLPLLALALSPGACLNRIPVEIPGVSTLGPSDEEQIVNVLDDVHRGMQSRRVFKVLAHVSHSYKDNTGRDYAGVEQYLQELFRAYKEIQITRVRPRVIVQGDQARAVETFGTRAEPFNRKENRPIEMHGQMNVYLEKINNKWMIVEWGRMF